MKVARLLELLKAVDPDAEILVFPPYADATDGACLREVIAPCDYWPHEVGQCNGEPYEIFYPGQPEDVAPPHTNVMREQMRVVLIGEELGNFRLGEK